MASTILDLAYQVDATADAAATLPNGDALAIREFRAVAFTGSGKDPHVIPMGASGDAAAGVAQFDVLLKYAGRANVTVRRMGISKMVVGTGGVTVGARVMADGDGNAVAATTGLSQLGIALQDGAVNEIVDVELTLGVQAAP